jgi:hypothetical protein
MRFIFQMAGVRRPAYPLKMGNAEGRKQFLQLQKDFVFAGAQRIGQDISPVMVDSMS